MLHMPCSIFCINFVAMARCSQWQHQLEHLVTKVTQWQNIALSKTVVHRLTRCMKRWEKCLHVFMLHIQCSTFSINFVAVARCSQWQHQLEHLVTKVTQWQNIAFKQTCSTSFDTEYEEMVKMSSRVHVAYAM